MFYRDLARQAVLLCGFAGSVFSQASSHFGFEVASVKISPSQTARGRMRGGPGTADPGRISFTNVTLYNVVLRAYDLKRFQLSAPDWMSSQEYDIVAQVPAGATPDECNRMLQTLLARRFHLVVHHETRELLGFDLVAGRRGPKLTASSESGGAASSAASEPPKRDAEGYPQLAGPGMAMMEAAKAGAVIVSLTARAQPLSSLTELLSREFQMPIADRTGLEGRFDFRLEFAPRPPGALPTSAEDDGAPNLTSAVQQQLGLRLSARRIATDLLIVDRADRVPTEN